MYVRSCLIGKESNPIRILLYLLSQSGSPNNKYVICLNDRPSHCLATCLAHRHFKVRAIVLFYSDIGPRASPFDDRIIEREQDIPLKQ